MALTKEQKTKQVNDIKEKVANQKSMVFVDFNKVPSKDMFELRKNLKAEGCNLKIAKKTLVRVAFGQSNISFWNKIKSSIPGQLALVLGIEDEIAPARIANKFAKDHTSFKILGGIFPAQGGSASGGENRLRFIGKDEVLALANLPSRNELLSRLVGSLSSSMTSFVRVLDKVRESKETSSI